MFRTIGLLAVGAVIGGTATWLFTNRQQDTGTLVAGGSTATGAAAAMSTSATDVQVQSVPVGTLPSARELERDAGAALQALASIESPSARRAAALALLDVVGDDAAGAERIAAALPAAERPFFKVDWLARLAERDPEGAFSEMLRLPSSTIQSMAAERIAAAWAAQDAGRALAESRLLPDSIAREFRTAVLTAWARLDGAAVLAYLETANPDPLEAVGAISYLSADAEGLLAAAERMPDPLGMTLEVTALGILAESDPQTAIGRVESMPAGPERDQAVMMIAMFYALEDPDAAMSWVEQMLPASPNARMLIAVSLAETDPGRALDMLSRGPPGAETQMLLGLIVQTAAQEPSRAESLAEDLAAQSDTRSRGLLENLMASWMQRDADGALAWIRARGTPLDPSVLGIAAANMANRDPGRAAGYLERIPPAYRDVWITRTAGPYGRNDLDGASVWVAQFQGQPVYNQAFGQVVSQAAQTNPEGAARLLSSARADLQRDSASAVALNWAGQDPQAAAQWALGLSDAGAREQALGGVTRVLAQRSPAEARALLDSRVSDPEARQRIEALAGLSQTP